MPGQRRRHARSILVEPRSNSLIVRAPNRPRKLARIRSLIDKLDRRRSTRRRRAGNIWVVYLKNADADQAGDGAARRVRAAAAATAAAAAAAGAPTHAGRSSANAAEHRRHGATPTGASAAATAPVDARRPRPSTGGFIQADPATNSLIITAPEPLYRQMRAMIDQLDGAPRAGLHREPDRRGRRGDNAANFGFQWQGLLGNSSDTQRRRRRHQLRHHRQPAQHHAAQLGGGDQRAAARRVTLGEGLNIGSVHNFCGTYGAGGDRQLPAEPDATPTSLSTPNLVTLDNEEAKIVVGRTCRS